jgi:ribosomal protein L21E
LLTTIYSAVREKRQGYQQKMKEQFDETRLLREFKEGDFVQLKNVLKGSKFDADYEGATLTIVRKTKGVVT